jgi:hypothetical protein
MSNRLQTLCLILKFCTDRLMYSPVIRSGPHSVGLLWARDRPTAERPVPKNTHSQQTDIYAPGGIGTRKRPSAGLRLRPRGTCEDWAAKINSLILHSSLPRYEAASLGNGPDIKEFFFDISTFENEHTAWPRKFGIRVPTGGASFPRRTESSATSLRKPQINFIF